MGRDVSLDDVDVVDLAPGLPFGVPVDTLLAAMTAIDAQMAQRQQTAIEAGLVLRMVGAIPETGRLRVSLEALPTTHPFARLDGTDSPSPVPSGAPPRSPSPKLPSKLTKLPHGAVRPTPGRSMFRSASPSPTAGRSMLGSTSPSPSSTNTWRVFALRASPGARRGARLGARWLAIVCTWPPRAQSGGTHGGYTKSSEPRALTRPCRGTS
jgi:hypothetical protein